MAGPGDPFDTAAVRRRVLTGWLAAPERFREDANAEEDLALGGYRDRLVVELAQNAADAAAAAGVPGRLLLRLDGDVLVAANTGARLGADGVLALSTLRASAKRAGGTTGRFGVGFASVLAVTDAPAVVGHGTGVRFSRDDTLAAVQEAAAASGGGGLAAELARRADHVPALRMPWPAGGSAPDSYDTAVLLPLRDGAARDLATALLLDVDDALLLALPALAEVVVELPDRPSVRVADVGDRWSTATRSGTHDDRALADRPTEERRRPGWSVTWAVPRDPTTPVPQRVYAPTPTDEPTSWSALLVADLPLDPTRRHVAPGPATDDVLGEASAGWADLLAGLAADGRDVLPLVPTGLPASAVDHAVREGLWRHLRSAPVLRGVESGDLVAPRDAVALAGAGADSDAVLGVLAPMLAGLVAAPRSADAVLAALDVRRLSLAEVVEAMPTDDDPASWGRRYAALAPSAVDGAVREALSAMPVPLADGRVVRGVRGLLLPGGALAGLGHELEVLADHGLRVVHPDVLTDERAADLLERLGAVPASATAALEHAAVASAVAWTTDDDDPAEVSDAVLAVVAAAWQERPWPPGSRTWLGDLALPDADGDPTPAGLLVQPGSAMAALLDPGTVGVLADDVAARWPAGVLQAVGVAGAPVLVRCDDVDLADLPPELDELDRADEWARHLRGLVADAQEVGAAEVLAVRDLDLVVADGWPRLVGLLAADRELRSALVGPVVLGDGAGGAVRGPSYTAWWLREELGLAGAVAVGETSGPAWAVLLPQAPGWAAQLPPDLRAALGIITGADDLTGPDWVRLLGRLGLDGDAPTVELLLALWRGLAATGDALDPVEGPRWALSAHATPVPVEPGGAVVVDDPRWLQRGDLAPFVVGPAGAGDALADLLDLDRVDEVADGLVSSSGHPVDVPTTVRRVLPPGPAPVATWHEHAELRVDGHVVDWWVSGADLHAATPAGLAAALAWSSGHWSRRALLAAVLSGATGADSAAVESTW